MLSIRNFVWFGALFLAVAAIGCKEAASDRKTYQVKGVVQELKPEKNTVVIKHEKIPGYMDAMTMPFEVKDGKELDGLQPGDTVSFRIIVTEKEGWIDQIQKLASAAPAPSKLQDGIRILREVEPLKIGDAVPDYPFTNELGQAMSLRQFQGPSSGQSQTNSHHEE